MDFKKVVIQAFSRSLYLILEYDGVEEPVRSLDIPDIDHVRVHPKFLHSNATSHKWALGALAELLDNSMDEVCNGATFVNIDVLKNPKDQTKMLLVEDNGGGMDPDKMRQCMSLGYSMKSKSANTIGQYGNGFKTSTMRLGADVIVFSRCRGKDGMSPTQSIGMLSYTFLRNTGKQDIIVPLVDYEKRDDDWHQMERSSSVAWKTNMDSIVKWSPYSSEAGLLEQFNFMFDQGTRIIIYNLWEDDEGQLELDFVTDAQDIQVRGANRDEKKIEMSKNFPNSRHFLTYHHSMRSYASILYLRLPQGFRIVLRGKEIEHHNIANDMMMKEEKIYRPQPGPDGVSKDPNIFAAVTIGFVKDAINHIDVQGFNVYHKNRLIKPFWRIWNAAGSDGRGVIGVLEANFIEPAHDKQGFERTAVLNRLEARLLRIQKNYWSSNCQNIGYAPRRQKKSIKNSEDNSIESSPETPKQPCVPPMMAKPSMVVQSNDSTRHQNSAKLSLHSNFEVVNSTKKPHNNGYEKSGECILLQQPRYHFSISSSNCNGSGQSNTECNPNKKSSDGSEDIACSSLLSSSVLNDGLRQSPVSVESDLKNMSCLRSSSMKMGAESYVNGLKALDFGMHTKLLANHNKTLKERIVTVEGKLLHDLKIAMQKNKELTEKIELLQKRLKDADKEQETIVTIFLEERERRDAEEEKWRTLLKVANDKINKLENFAISGIKSELQ
ncbi:protein MICRORCHIDIA 4-like [Dendrobium catenatum]|uniref:protein MICRORCHIDIA 4-like n=1 Tax=Dendrobium catenatum TaxID=906689 RepID=UPI00109F5F3A|nr:protein MICRORCHIDIA 4-like [Dendrobium catenatum]